MNYTGAYTDLVKGAFLANCILANNYSNEKVSFKAVNTLKRLAERTLEWEILAGNAKTFKTDEDKTVSELNRMGLIDHSALNPKQSLALYITATLEVATELENIYFKPGQYIKANEDGSLVNLADCIGESLTTPVINNNTGEFSDILNYFIQSFMNNSEHVDATAKDLLATPAAEIVLSMSEEINENLILRVNGKEKFFARLRELELNDLVVDMERVIEADKSPNKTTELLAELEELDSQRIEPSDIFK